MSASAVPIPAPQFAIAIRDLPLENIYAKAHEIENSIAHLVRSNAQLKAYSDSLSGEGEQEADEECLEAIRENDVVIERQRERVRLLREEVERRGGRWHGSAGGDEVKGLEVRQTNGAQVQADSGGVSAPDERLTDGELSRRILERIADDGEESEDGMHL